MDLSYEGYELNSSNLEVAEKFDTTFAELGFHQLVDANHGIPSLGINQVFFKTEHQFVMVKHGVQGQFPVNEIIQTPTGFMYHLKASQKFYMIYFRGHTLEGAKQIIYRLQDKTSHSPLKKMTNALIPSAHAGCEVATGNSILGNKDDDIAHLNALAKHGDELSLRTLSCFIR